MADLFALTTSHWVLHAALSPEHTPLATQRGNLEIGKFFVAKTPRRDVELRYKGMVMLDRRKNLVRGKLDPPADKERIGWIVFRTR